jgi:hypothetical protein
MGAQRSRRECAARSEPTGRYKALLDLLVDYPGERAFNQYRDELPELDLPGGAAARRRNLCAYLDLFADAQIILVGEAAGYAGCRFSGIPFTCERQLAGQDRLPWTNGESLARTSSAQKLWVERSARIVWGAIGDGREFVLWNAFPWHPFGRSGPLSNRAPGRDLWDGLDVLRCFLDHFPRARPCAVGRVAERGLAKLGISAPYLRHPSRGGKAAFCAGVEALRRELAQSSDC